MKEQKPKLKWTSSIVELAVSNYFNPRTNIIVPNVSWGLGLLYEADMLVVSQERYRVREVEIKVSKADIKADLKKRRHHDSIYVRQVYFAVPEDLKDDPNIPKDFGILSVSHEYHKGVTLHRQAKIRKDAKPLTEDKLKKLLHLGCMRIWDLKATLKRRAEENHALREKLKFHTDFKREFLQQ